MEFVDDTESVMDLAVAEMLDIISPAPTMNAARYKGIGYYNLAALAGNAELIDGESLSFMPTLEQYQEGNVWYDEKAKLIKWEDMGPVRLGWKLSTDRGPYYISRTPMGTYAFWPPLRQKSMVQFEYTRNYTDMVEPLDVPVGLPAKYQMWLVWRAVQEYGDFQQNGQIWSRGNKNAEKIMFLMERDNAPEMTMGNGWR